MSFANKVFLLQQLQLYFFFLPYFRLEFCRILNSSCVEQTFLSCSGSYRESIQSLWLLVVLSMMLVGRLLFQGCWMFFFYHGKNVAFYQMLFLCLLKCSWFLSFILLIRYITSLYFVRDFVHLQRILIYSFCESSWVYIRVILLS